MCRAFGSYFKLYNLYRWIKIQRNNIQRASGSWQYTTGLWLFTRGER